MVDPYDGINVDYNAFEPIILQTTLAASLVAYLERIPWDEVTCQMLCDMQDAARSCVGTCCELLGILVSAAVSCTESDRSSQVPALLLRQVHRPLGVDHTFSAIPLQSNPYLTIHIV